MKKELEEKLTTAAGADLTLYTDRTKVDQTLGHNPAYLLDMHGITKSDLIRLERKGLALKARYEVRHPKADFWDKLDETIRKKQPDFPGIPRKCGTHRVRWLIFKEPSNG